MWSWDKSNLRKIVSDFNSSDSSQPVEKRISSYINSTERPVKWFKKRAYEILEAPSINHHKIDLLNSLDKIVIGQNEAKHKILDSIINSILSIRPRRWPISVLFLVWPTWVWKTEIPKALAQAIFWDRESITKIACETYTEDHTLSNVFWSPKGYVWYKDDTPFSARKLFKPYEKAKRKWSLHDCVKKLDNFNIILFDEIEKASPVVIQSLLSVIDEGKIDFPSGKTTSLANSIIFFTSNIWQSEINKSLYTPPIWFVQDNVGDIKSVSEKIFNDSMKTKFSPEFIWRLDDVIIFDNIWLSECRKILEIQVSDINDALKKFYKESRVNLSLDNSLYKHIIDLWYSREKWARELVRVFKSEFESNLNSLLHSKEFFQYLCDSWDITLNAFFSWWKIYFKVSYNSNKHRLKKTKIDKPNILKDNDLSVLTTLSEIYSLCSDYVGYCSIDVGESNKNYSQCIREIQNKLVNVYWFSSEDINILREKVYIEHLKELDFINTFEGIQVYSRKNRKLFYPHSQKFIYRFLKSKIYEFMKDNQEVDKENKDVFVRMVVSEIKSLLNLDDLSPRQSSEIINYTKKIVLDYYDGLA